MKKIMKRFILSYDINDNKCTEKEVWDALYDMKGVTIVDKPVLSTLILESSNELMHLEIDKKLKTKFRGKLYFVVSRIAKRKREDGCIVSCYCQNSNPESQKQIQEYLKEKMKQILNINK